MITLAVDSSGRAAGVALLRGDSLLYEAYLNNGLTHSETLLPMVAAALQAAGVEMQDIGLLGVGAGPGSFTGLRIGMALIKGLALPGNLPCVGVSSLEGLAAGIFVPQGSCIVAAEDARRGEVYAAAFVRGQDGLVRLCEDTAGRPEALAPLLLEQKKTIFLVGDGAEVCYNNLKTFLPLQVVPPTWRLGRAAGVALCAFAAWQRGEAAGAAHLQPAYHRLSQAQRQRQEKLKESENQ